MFIRLSDDPSIRRRVMFFFRWTLCCPKHVFSTGMGDSACNVKAFKGIPVYIYINMHSEACSKAPSQELLHRSLSRDQESLCSTQSMSNLQPKPGCNENPCHTAGDHQYPSIHVNQCSLILVDLDRLQPPPPDCTAEHLVPKSATLRGSVIETRNGRERSWLNPTAADDTCFLMQYM